MTVVSNPTALTETATIGPPQGPALVEANLDEVNGNKFSGRSGGAKLYVRNTTGAAIGVDFYADLFGNEVLLIDGSLAANKVPANGVKVFGPFNQLFENHATSIASTANGQIVCLQESGAAGDLKAAVLPDV